MASTPTMTTLGLATGKNHICSFNTRAEQMMNRWWIIYFQKNLTWRDIYYFKLVKFKQITELPYTLNIDGQKEWHSWPIHNFHTWLVNYPHLPALPPPLWPAVLSKNFTHTLATLSRPDSLAWPGVATFTMKRMCVFSTYVNTKWQIYGIQLMPQVYECEGLQKYNFTVDDNPFNKVLSSS